ncbi:unnamed protein product, partial [Closterium sp. NIES-54]
RGFAAGGTSADVTGAGSGAGLGGARTGGTGAAGAGGAELGGAAAGGAGPGGAGAEGSRAAAGTGTAGGPGAAGAGSTAQPRLFFAPPSPSSQPPSDSMLRQVLSLPSSTGLPLQPGSPLPAPSPYTEQTGGLTERRAPASRPVSPVRSGRSGCSVLQRFGFTWSSVQATPLATGHSLSAPPLDEFVELSGPYPELVGCLMYLMTCTRPDLAYPLGLLARYVAPSWHRKVHMDAAKRVLRYLCSTSSMGLVLGGRGDVVLTGHSDASWVDDQATQRSSQGYTFSLGSGSVSWRSTRSSSVLSSSCEAQIYATAMAAQELRWLTYLLTDLGEWPRSPPVLYVDNKAAIALCQEHRLEHRTKHIALRYFLARELQQRGQLRLAHVAIRANTADIFTKALPPGDHQRFCTLLGLVPTLPHLL